MFDKDAVEAQVRRFADAFNAKDAKALARCFAEDATFVNLIAVRMEGRAGIEAGHAGHFAGALAKSRIAFTEIDTRSLTGDVAISHATWTRDAVEAPDGTTLPPGKGILTFVATKQGSEWLLATGQNTQAGALPVKPR